MFIISGTLNCVEKHYRNVKNKLTNVITQAVHITGVEHSMEDSRFCTGALECVWQCQGHPDRDRFPTGSNAKSAFLLAYRVLFLLE